MMKRRMKSFLEGLEYQQESPGQMREELSHTFLKGNVLKGARASELPRQAGKHIRDVFFPIPSPWCPSQSEGIPWCYFLFSGTSWGFLGHHASVTGTGNLSCTENKKLNAKQPSDALDFLVSIYIYICIPFSLPPLLAVGGEFRGPMGKFPKQPGTYILGMCLLTHGHNVYSGLRGCLRKNHAWTPLHGLLHPRGTGKKKPSFLLCPF